ncbi:hypothetical protein EMIT0P44_440038 [Pseudomonas sp. IT-P44]
MTSLFIKSTLGYPSRIESVVDEPFPAYREKIVAHPAIDDDDATGCFPAGRGTPVLSRAL